MIVYIDVLLVLNFAVNLILLRICARIFRLHTTSVRLFLGALSGAVGALWIFLPPMHILFQLLYKLLLSFLLSAVSFGLRPWQTALRGLIGVLLTGGAFAGLILLAELLFAPVGFYSSGSIVYAPVSPMTILLFCAGCYLLVWLLSPLFIHRPDCTCQLPVSLEVHLSGQILRMQVLPDSGNLLKEPFSGKHVLVCRPELLSRLTAPPAPQTMRLIPCATVTGTETLTGYLAKEVFLLAPHGRQPLRSLYIAPGQSSFPPDYDAILHPAALEVLPSSFVGTK